MNIGVFFLLEGARDGWLLPPNTDNKGGVPDEADNDVWKGGSHESTYL